MAEGGIAGDMTKEEADDQTKRSLYSKISSGAEVKLTAVEAAHVLALLGDPPEGPPLAQGFAMEPAQGSHAPASVGAQHAGLLQKEQDKRAATVEDDDEKTTRKTRR